jgi:hypothetical protein
MSKIILSAACVLIILLVGYILYLNRPLTEKDCLKLGSDFRATKCLQMINETTPVPTNISFNVSQITISDQSMIGNTYGNPNPTYSATVKDGGVDPAFDVYMKFKFYKYDANINCNVDDPEDTQYEKVAGVLMPGDPLKVSVVVPTNFDTSGQIYVLRINIFCK